MEGELNKKSQISDQKPANLIYDFSQSLYAMQALGQCLKESSCLFHAYSLKFIILRSSHCLNMQNVDSWKSVVKKQKDYWQKIRK